MPANANSGSAALVLGSGGARAAYEVGVARFLFEGLRAELGHAPDLRILCGTSAGALNASVLAAHADQPLAGVSLLARRWSEMRLEEMVRPDKCEILRLVRALLGRPSRRTGAGSLLDPRPLQHLAHDTVPFGRIEERIADGSLEALALGTTEVASGRNKVFVRRGRSEAPLDRTMVEVRAGDLRPEHALASAAIPLLFPAVEIDGGLHCDGSLRQSVPLSPAHRLGADRMVVVTTQHSAPAVAPPWLAHERVQSMGSPVYVVGKAINALHLDRIDDDLDRLGLVNDLLAAGARAFGAGFQEALNRELVAATGRAVLPLRTALVRPSESLGRLAADYVNGRAFRRRPGTTASAFARLADVEAEHEADLVSYLLFDGPFAQELMELGHSDARAAGDHLRALFLPAVASPVRREVRRSS
jgi:NTE family protein